MKGPRKDISSSPCNLILMMELRKKLLTFRDIIDLPPCQTIVSMDMLLLRTIKDLHSFYPGSIPQYHSAELKGLPLDKVLIYFCKALQELGDTSKMNDEWIDKYRYNIFENDKCKSVERLVEIAVATLHGLIKIAKEKFDMMDEYEEKRDYSPKDNTFGKALKDSYNSDNCSGCSSPVTPTSVLPDELINGSPKSPSSSSLLLSLRVQAVGKLNPIDVKRLTLRMLPDASGTKSLRPKRSTTKLKRSSHMGNLYRILKVKLEGSNTPGKSPSGRRTGVGSGGNGKQGMADALAEMTRRSAYFQQIEQDVQKYAKAITELKSSITTFKTTDMAELLKFHKNIESVLEKLTDESQVLARFEGFPIKKLETIRAAAALHLKFESIINELQKWKIEPPLSRLLDNAERYFNKIKGEVDAMERTKDEESKKFKSHNIEFDFLIIVRIKEAMVDLSSNCMEIALKERREAKLAAENKTLGSKLSKSETQNKCNTKLLWKAFQFAFRVYTFAGGHDERADRLTRELAKEIETDPEYKQSK
ncbi:hypothetical protein COLO4_22781 [Corchorus olitorius]|uniref:Uncharacterized protein n=1 Tax=Corchorus olitorius TaxID=93759 RepID=A0A1R3IJW3_9ROSI|nr:hypothetical protein COLO4_22781 [Corchorus olitorius]